MEGWRAGVEGGGGRLVIWGQLLSLAGACRWVMRKNCRIISFFVFGSYVKINFVVVVVDHGNLAWTFTIWLETLNTRKTKTISTASVPTLGQIAWICTIPTSKNTGCLSIPFWLSVSHQKEHQLSLLPKHLLSPPRGSHVFHRTVLPGFDLDKEVPPPPHVYTRKIFSCGGKKMNLSQISDTLQRETGSVLPLWYVLGFFFSFFNCLSVT